MPATNTANQNLVVTAFWEVNSGEEGAVAALLQSHPDLAGKEAQAGAMTASSVTEQASAGLNSLSKEEMVDISGLNAAYKKKFGFPFIIAVRMHTKEGIFFEFRRRLSNDTVTEFANDLQNVYIITRLRLAKMLESS